MKCNDGHQPSKGLGGPGGVGDVTHKDAKGPWDDGRPLEGERL